MSDAPDTPLAPWQQRVHDQALAALEGGRMGHALLFCGPAMLGKRRVAERLAGHLLGCGRDARAARLFAAGTHPDFSAVGFIPTRDGSRLRTELVIEQVRELSERFSLTPQYRDTRVALVDPADALNNAAGNALLKTLEEPQPGRYLWLVAANPMRLPATIRSRCQRLEFRLPPRGEALEWLLAQGHDEAAASEALDAARGHPGLADAWLRDGGVELRREVAADLAALARGGLAASEAGRRWTDDEAAGQRLRHAADLAAAMAADLTDPGRTRRLAAWFDEANRTRELLRTTVRADLAVAGLLLQWRQAAGEHDGPVGRRR